MEEPKSEFTLIGAKFLFYPFKNKLQHEGYSHKGDTSLSYQNQDLSGSPVQCTSTFCVVYFVIIVLSFDGFCTLTTHQIHPRSHYDTLDVEAYLSSLNRNETNAYYTDISVPMAIGTETLRQFQEEL